HPTRRIAEPRLRQRAAVTSPDRFVRHDHLRPAQPWREGLHLRRGRCPRAAAADREPPPPLPVAHPPVSPTRSAPRLPPRETARARWAMAGAADCVRRLQHTRRLVRRRDGRVAPTSQRPRRLHAPSARGALLSLAASHPPARFYFPAPAGRVPQERDHPRLFL